MATQKGAKVTKVVTNVLVMKVDRPGAGMQPFSEIDPEDEDQLRAFIDTAEGFERGGVKYELLRRETQVRTQIAEVPTTIEELKGDNEGSIDE